MKTSTTEIIVWFMFLVSSLSSAVLTGYEHNADITEDSRFGCVWQGGTSPGLKCVCREDVQMKISEKSIPPYDTASIEISDCKNVIFGSQSVAEMRNLRNIKLKNIASLQFETSSLTWHGYRERNQYEERFDLSIPSLKITIEDCNVTLISDLTFEGRINTIHFERVIVDNVRPFSFNSLMQTQNVIMKNVLFKNAREQTFKKFATENLQLEGVRAQLIPSRFLNNITVYGTFKIIDCVFDTVRPGGFIVTHPTTFQVTGTNITNLDGEAFKVTTRGDVLFRNNNFDNINDGAFSVINLNREATADATITFDSNVFATLTRDSLAISDTFRPKFANLKINESCDCKSIDHKIKNVAFYGEIKCMFYGDYVTVEQFKADACTIIQSYSTVIVIVAVVITLCFIIGVVLVVYYRRVYLSKKYGNDKNSKKGNMSLIVPDGRTYRETELHVIVEKVDLLTTDL